MPFRSSSQRSFFFSSAGRAAGISLATAKEFAKATGNKKLPAHVKRAHAKRSAHGRRR